MPDCLIVGGGVIGLSLAYELAGHGLRVRIIDRGEPGREASWAGAGILPPASRRSKVPIAKLRILSNLLHAKWAEALAAETGVDNGYRPCGGIYLARDEAAGQTLLQTAELWREGQIAVELIAPAELAQLEPALQPADGVSAALLLPEERQLRNPRHLKALLSACVRRGVEIVSGVAAEDFEIGGGRVRQVRTNTGVMSAESVCITTGAWSQALVARLGIEPSIKPIRGQIALLATRQPVVSRVVNEGACYFVPRSDGRLLVGSTEEDVGFDRNTTAGGLAGLLDFAIGLAPTLAHATLERSWAGLRPSTPDGQPYLGRVPGLENAFVAAGHFRSGLQLSTGTAVVMSQLIRGEQPQIDLSPFRLDRIADVTVDFDSPEFENVFH